MRDERGIRVIRVNAIAACDALEDALTARYETRTSGWETRRH